MIRKTTMMMRKRRKTGPAMIPTSSTGPHMEGCSGSLRCPGKMSKVKEETVKTRDSWVQFIPQTGPPVNDPHL